MNSTVKPIFNESFTKKKRFVSPVNRTQDPHKMPNASKNVDAGISKRSLNATTTFPNNKNNATTSLHTLDMMITPQI